MNTTILVVLLLLAGLPLFNSSKENDRIKKLPGQPTKGRPKFGQYAGFVTVNKTAGNALFYYFAEAERNLKKAPLVLWLTGGPFCSSVAFGAFTEVGPFKVATDGKTLIKNKLAWNKAANMLFVDQPITTGYSYSNTSETVIYGDHQAVLDMYLFLLNWLARFREYKNVPFYLAGESFAGHFGPLLAKYILERNKLTNKFHIQLKGIIIGNPFLDRGEVENAKYEYLYQHSLLSKETQELVLKSCDFTLPLELAVKEKACLLAYKRAQNELTTSVHPYNIQNDPCPLTGVTDKPKDALVKFTLKPKVENLVPCMEDIVQTYLERRDVKSAFRVTNNKHYVACEYLSSWDYIDNALTVVPILRSILDNGIPVWLYGGDLDSVVPVLGTLKSLKELNLTEKTAWRPWYLNGPTRSKVAGYTVVFEGGLTYATVRRAGHLVPADKPEEALVIFKSFLEGVPLPVEIFYTF